MRLALSIQDQCSSDLKYPGVKSGISGLLLQPQQQMSESPVHSHFNNDALPTAEVLRARIAWFFFLAVAVEAVGRKTWDATTLKRPKGGFVDIILALAIARTCFQAG